MPLGLLYVLTCPSTTLVLINEIHNKYGLSRYTNGVGAMLVLPTILPMSVEGI